MADRFVPVSRRGFDVPGPSTPGLPIFDNDLEVPDNIAGEYVTFRVWATFNSPAVLSILKRDRPEQTYTEMAFNQGQTFEHLNAFDARIKRGQLVNYTLDRGGITIKEIIVEAAAAT